jgi:asparagine synthetase B (glutamine-hydrolysing)
MLSLNQFYNKLNYFITSLIKFVLLWGNNCPSCNSDNSIIVERKYLITSLKKCHNCQLMFRVPNTTVKENKIFYQDDYSQEFGTDCPNNEQLKIMYYELKYYLCSKLLRDADWTSMANSIELRTPLVDWSFFNKLIPLIKNDNSINKKIASKSMKDKIPKDIINRKKTGFVIPHDLYLKKMSYKKEYANPIRDWSILSYEKYLQNKKN